MPWPYRRSPLPTCWNLFAVGTHFPNVISWTLIFRATSAIGRCPSMTNLTASCLYSSVKLRRVAPLPETPEEPGQLSPVSTEPGTLHGAVFGPMRSSMVRKSCGSAGTSSPGRRTPETRWRVVAREVGRDAGGAPVDGVGGHDVPEFGERDVRRSSAQLSGLQVDTGSQRARCDFRAPVRPRHTHCRGRLRRAGVPGRLRHGLRLCCPTAAGLVVQRRGSMRLSMNGCTRASTRSQTRTLRDAEVAGRRLPTDDR